jgi:tRNA A-37 threonylcarbamoyl transferase component Bud32
MADTTRPASETSLDADLSGRQLAGYRLLRQLGRGAMAEVYLAEQISLSRQVAFKVLRSSLATDATYVQRFHQEARAAAQLVHANIVQIYEVGCVEGVHFIAQEYVQGSNLAELLARRGVPDLAKVIAVMRQVTAALHKAAEQGIVHRDIKPENIMLAASGEVKVADFGLARPYGQDASAANLTQIGVTMGTPLYMSPEQVEGRHLDPRSDIYSLGVTCYQMLSGEPPFRGESALSIAVQHLKTQPQRLELIRPDLPASICRIVHKTLAKNPDDRYATPRELMHELRGVSIELFHDDPGEEVDGWASTDLVGAVEARRNATERLAVAMRTTAMPAVRRGSASRWAMVAAACLVLGAALAWALRERPLIARTEDDDESVLRFDTAADQFLYAQFLNSEAAWKSVPRYFPDDAYARRARQQLSLLYLRELAFEPALQIFGEFAQVNDAEVQDKAFGLAGQAVVLNRLGKYQDSVDKLVQLWPRRESLDNDMRTLVMLTLASDRKNLKKDYSEPKLRKWNQWFEKSSPPAQPAPSEPSAARPAGSS